MCWQAGISSVNKMLAQEVHQVNIPHQFPTADPNYKGGKPARRILHFPWCSRFRPMVVCTDGLSLFGHDSISGSRSSHRKLRTENGN
jgi:hypothetical protein